MKARSIYLTAKQWQELREEATKVGVSLAEYLRRVIDAAKEVRRHLSGG